MIYYSLALFSIVSMGFVPSIKLLLIVVLAILLQYYCYGSSIMEAVRDMELESQLKILNKTPIKTIQTEVGDIFDCIDINKQPSLGHPFLQNHIIKTSPISYSNTMVNDDHKVVVSSSTSSPSYVKLSSKIAIMRKLGCPYGTVPIRRISKEDLIRAESFSKLSHLLFFRIDNIGDDLENPGQGQFLSIAKTRKDSGIDYLGIRAHISIHNPLVTEDQVSTAQLWIENGPKEDFNSLQAGWIVAPSLLGDNITRLFGKWQVDGSNKSAGCYNILCPGFVQVDKYRPIDGIIGPISQVGAPHEFKVAISQDGDGNWWLDVEDIKIGYWPAELGFSQLTRGSPIIAWGGLATQLGAVAIPPTGNGEYPHSYVDYDRQCFMRQMKVIPTKTLYWEDPTMKIIETFATNEKCSNIIYYGHEPKGFGHTIAFGGPGGNC